MFGEALVETVVCGATCGLQGVDAMVACGVLAGREAAVELGGGVRRSDRVQQGALSMCSKEQWRGCLQICVTFWSHLPVRGAVVCHGIAAMALLGVVAPQCCC